MKIAFVYDLIYPHTIGGGEKRLVRLAEELADLGHQVYYITCNYLDNKQEPTKFKLVPVSNPSLKAKIQKKRDLITTLRFSCGLAQHLIKNRYEIVDLTNFPYIPAIVAVLILKLQSRKYCITWLEFTGDYWIKQFGMIGYLGVFVEKLLKKLSKQNITISKFTQDRLGIGNDSHIISFPIVYQNNEVLNNGKYFLSISRFEKHKRLDLLVQSFSIFKKKSGSDAKLIIVGSGIQVSVIKTFIKNNELHNDVKLMEGLSEQELSSLYQSAIANIVCSEREGLGLTILEAMSRGTPSIVCKSQFSAAPELIQQNINGLIVESDPDIIADAMIHVMESNLRVPEESLSHFVPSAVTKKLLDFYSLILR